MEETKASIRGYGIPPWNFKGRAIYQFHLVKSQVARALIPKDFRLVEAFGYTLGGFFLANYDDSPAGAFDELVVIAGLVWNPPTSCAWASKVLVNSNEACLHGRTEVGLPSHVARFTKLTANKEQQASRFNRFLNKFGVCSTMPDPKVFLETQVAELDASASTEEIFNINLLSSLPQENSKKAWLGPHIKMSLPSFSGRTQYHSSLLKYSCQMESRVRIVHPLLVSTPSHTADLQTQQPAVEDQNSSSVNQANRNSLSLTVMLSKPILALEFSCLTMNVETPLVISE
ncbi:protein NEOXANTHIN-DEFICIENT 1 isoform X2 [Silene latifolia]|uniref:protein NEOXANTHIN-DEFICIENT 1 isoform X2 n=1 Tax=Silene latifolia TaxID=37657 RepID=UPI003D76A9BF